MANVSSVNCLHCGKEILVRPGTRNPPRYHKNCAWYEIPCQICGKPMAIHREWEHPPFAHKECKDAQAAQFYTKPCEVCGEPIRVRQNAVKVPRHHRKCESKARKLADRTRSRPLRVFMSHASEDKQRAQQLSQHLRQSGYAPWLDKERLLPGQDWNHEISKAVRSSDVVIICLSRASTDKVGYVQREIAYALNAAEERPEGSIFLIPVKLEECSVPARLSRWHWVNLTEEDGLTRLLQALQHLTDSLTQ